MPMEPVSPRPLSGAERAVLAHVLSVEFPGAAELRSQLDQVRVVARWQAGSTSVDFRVAAPARRSPQSGGFVPVDATVFDDHGESTGELLVWVRDGVLDSLEHAWWTEAMPTVLPPVERVRLSRRP